MKAKNRLITMRGKRFWPKPLLLVLVVSALVSGCVGTPAMLNPASATAARVSNLTWAILGIAAFVFIVVEALLLITVFRYRGRVGAPIPKQIAGNVPLEIGWTAFPAIVLAVIFALTLGTLFAVDIPPAQAGTAFKDPTKAIHVVVIGHQWWWEYQYPDLKITTANELHIPVNSAVYLDIQSNDVIHSFWVPELGHKMDGIPGRINHVWYYPTKTGRFNGQCAEFCGEEHALMLIHVVVDSPDQFNAWVKQQQAPIPNNLTGQAALGEQMFMTANCVVCHAINGTKANGQIGPNLTHFASRQTFAGGAYENNLDNVANWIQVPHQMKPGTIMPNLGPMPNMGYTIATFLESLK